MLISTERPVGSWLSPAALSEHSELLQWQGEGEADNAGSGLSALLSGLQQAPRTRQQALLPPGSPLESSSSSFPATTVHAAGGQTDQHLPNAAGGNGADGVIDLTHHKYSPTGGAPTVPAGLLLAPQARQNGQGSRALPGASPPGPSSSRRAPQQGTGHATLLWLDSDGSQPGGKACGGNTASGSPGGLAAALSPAGLPPPAQAVSVQALGLAPDLLPLLGRHAVLGSSSAAVPAVALCTVGPRQLHLMSGAAQLARPDAMPEGSLVRLRGLAVVPGSLSGMASSDVAETTAAAGTTTGAGAPAAGPTVDQALVWALFAGAAKTNPAPFLGAALAGSRQQQVWLACYSLQQLLTCDAAVSGTVPGGTASARACAAPAEPAQTQERQGQRGKPSAALASGAPGSDCPATAVEAAVMTLQGEVAALRRGVNARLDGIEAQLRQLLQALRQPP